jgi:hypothetical protein
MLQYDIVREMPVTGLCEAKREELLSPQARAARRPELAQRSFDSAAGVGQQGACARAYARSPVARRTRDCGFAIGSGFPGPSVQR